jgi:hypothetical protein
MPVRLRLGRLRDNPAPAYQVVLRRELTLPRGYPVMLRRYRMKFMPMLTYTVELSTTYQLHPISFSYPPLTVMRKVKRLSFFARNHIEVNDVKLHRYTAVGFGALHLDVKEEIAKNPFLVVLPIHISKTEFPDAPA